MIDSKLLLADLKKQLVLLTTDLRARAEEPGLEWAAELRAQHSAAVRRGRTAFTWSVWRDGRVDQAAVAWLVACAFVRFGEDNGLLDGAADSSGRAVAVPWLAGPTDGPLGDRLARASENETVFYRGTPTANARDWLQEAFAVLASLPAGRLLVDRAHNPVWKAPISAEAAGHLLSFWRRHDDDGALVHDFTDTSLDTRFLGDLYQDLSEHAKKTYALLQTPVFVEEFILDRTLQPAMLEFGLEGLKVIDPTCGSGHFLLGAFARLDAAWQQEAPGMESRDRVQTALDSIHGVDLNPFAIAIARFRLTVAALKAAGETSLVGAPDFDYHLAIGDSLLAAQGHQDTLNVHGDEEDVFTYASEDVAEYQDILEQGRYHVVVGNPPYITVKDKALNERYRKAYPGSTKGKYALSAPFMELFFRLARRAGPAGGAGFVGQITSNSFMKREFGSKVIENLLAGNDLDNPVDLSEVIDTSGAYIPGHGTPTVILVGRRRRAVGDTVRAVLGVRGEPGQPVDPAKGLVWTEVVEHLDSAGFDGIYVTVTDLDRAVLAVHPWSLSGGGAKAVLQLVDNDTRGRVGDHVARIGFFGIMGAEDAFMTTASDVNRLGDVGSHRNLVIGDKVRDFAVQSANPTFFPYDREHVLKALSRYPAMEHRLWPLRSELGNRATFAKGTYFSEGRPWYEWHQLPKDVDVHSWSITFAFVSTHNHFVLDRGGKVFKQSAPVIKLPADATEDEYLDLLGVLNSSTACFWLKQVSHDKGNGGYGGGIADQEWERFFEFTGTKLQEFPLPPLLPRERARLLDRLAQDLNEVSPASSVPAALAAADADLAHAVEEARGRWASLRRRLFFEQEELDWEVYRLYGLIDEDLTYAGGGIDHNELGDRAFEVTLARAVAAGVEETAWFDRHGSTPITELPAEWPQDYRDLVQRRLDLIASDKQIGLLERPEYKRRWQTPGWDVQLKAALETAVLDRLERPELWSDPAGVTTRTVGQLAELVSGDAALLEALRLLSGTQDVNVVKAVTALLTDEAVPYLAAHRFKEPGLEKFAEWQRVWDLQRQEDAPKTADAPKSVDIPVPPKYGQADFRHVSIWKARGKLDVPKERFISYPSVSFPDDPTPVLGWAGWDHRDQAIALARLIGEQQADAPSRTPLVAGLVELEPWLHQWHGEIDPASGVVPADTITTMIDSELDALGATRDDVAAWRPEPARRGRRRA
ncbi:BREX-2 system adenine-specific DNA-methyltransferase PglX [Occultella gossypii]|uniref:site-specific DNA-methyltransferase (adenine-specific) n=1 Tax=Occultella gossypii TaxID=2800820 RepID=A0ABS7S6P0_9MICO|nr:BREX-2 system adenine-specific DNA-methyltransferase PglX [Occultella gossypii]MBZ2195400.1 BREX-2 system adenine-specific DNA-methyltransferase PglX [Occultella gossypii]